MSGRPQSEARCELDGEARLLHDRLRRALLLSRTGQLALVQSATSGAYRFVEARVPEPPGLLGWCDASTTCEQIRSYMVGESRPSRSSPTSTGRSA